MVKHPTRHETHRRRDEDDEDEVQQAPPPPPSPPVKAQATSSPQPKGSLRTDNLAVDDSGDVWYMKGGQYVKVGSIK